MSQIRFNLESIQRVVIQMVFCARIAVACLAVGGERELERRRLERERQLGL